MCRPTTQLRNNSVTFHSNLVLFTLMERNAKKKKENEDFDSFNNNKWVGWLPKGNTCSWRQLFTTCTVFDRLAIRNLSFRSRVQMQPKRFKSNVLFSGKAFKINWQIKPIAVNTSNNPFFAFTTLFITWRLRNF